jgi:diguanylate cyclase (GGDEF)-like protein
MTKPALSIETSTSSTVVVDSELSLRNLVDLRETLPARYVLVRNPFGEIEGIVDLYDAQMRLAVDNPVERARWESAPVSSLCEHALNAYAEEPLLEDSREGAADAPVAINDPHGCAAIVAGGQLFVNWSRIANTITRNQVDPVTLLPTRQAFNRRLLEEIERAQRNQLGLAVVMIDIDHFKTINDRFGHSTGDTALRTVGSVLRRCIRSYDFVARFGGDEFAVIYSDCDPSSIELPLNRLQSDINSLAPVDEASGVRISLSIGAAVMTRVDLHCPAELLFEQADGCLYQAKREGRCRAISVELDAFGLPITPARQIVAKSG